MKSIYFPKLPESLRQIAGMLTSFFILGSLILLKGTGVVSQGYAAAASYTNSNTDLL